MKPTTGAMLISVVILFSWMGGCGNSDESATERGFGTRSPEPSSPTTSAQMPRVADAVDHIKPVPPRHGTYPRRDLSNGKYGRLF
jgi:hypothetical protein